MDLLGAFGDTAKTFYAVIESTFEVLFSSSPPPVPPPFEQPKQSASSSLTTSTSTSTTSTSSSSSSPSPYSSSSSSCSSSSSPPSSYSPAKKNKAKLTEEAQNKHGIDIFTNYNFAVVGPPGSGKSSLINAVRGVSDAAHGSAPVGEVECTCKATAYPHPRHPFIVFWDLPGAGTSGHPATTYFEDETLYAFDGIIIATGDRFTEIDLEVASKANEWGTPVFFVRTKADQALEAKERRTPPGTDIRGLFRKEVSESVLPKLQQKGVNDCKLYIISAWAYTASKIPQMDEKDLIHDILQTAISRRNASNESQTSDSSGPRTTPAPLSVPKTTTHDSSLLSLNPSASTSSVTASSPRKASPKPPKSTDVRHKPYVTKPQKDKTKKDKKKKGEGKGKRKNKTGDGEKDVTTFVKECENA